MGKNQFQMLIKHKIDEHFRWSIKNSSKMLFRALVIVEFDYAAEFCGELMNI